MFLFTPPQCKDRQLPYHNTEIQKKVKEYLKKVLDKGYIEVVEIQLVESIMCMFYVEKGLDIRMIYNRLKLGPNNALWGPWFALPTINTITWRTVAGTWLATMIMEKCF